MCCGILGVSMKIVFTGGPGGHFYPLIAIAESLRDLVRERHLLMPELYFIAPDPFDTAALFENKITYIYCPAGKLRRYFSFQNFLDMFKTARGLVSALITLFQLYPDVVISKGGFGSVPVTLAANILGIPVIIHDSDAKPGRASLFAASRATRIAIAFDSARVFFPKKVQDRIALVGIPIRSELAIIAPEGGAQELGLDTSVPTVLIFGGSSGSQKINDVIIAALPDLVGVMNVIHQTGKANFADVQATSSVVLSHNPLASRYHPFPYLNISSIRKAVSASTLIVSRAGATAISEIALWHKPAILIPIPEAVSHDQRTNAYAYAHTGGAVVLEESNLTPHVLVSEVKRIGLNVELSASMGQKGASFASPQAGRIIADEALSIALSHEPQSTV